MFRFLSRPARPSCYLPFSFSPPWLRLFPRTHLNQGDLCAIGFAMSFSQLENYTEELCHTLDQDATPGVPVQRLSYTSLRRIQQEIYRRGGHVDVPVIGYDYIRPAIAVEIADGNAVWGVAGGKVYRGEKGSITVSQES